MKDNILLINLPYVVHDPGFRSYAAFPYGLLSVATYNKSIANIRVVDCNTDEIVNINLDEFRPDIVGLAMQFDNSYSELSRILDFV
jgi:hypothetical protein